MEVKVEPLVLDLKAPHQKYYDPSGKLVPGVTTVNGVLGKDALIAWAARVEREGCLAHFAEHGNLDNLPEGMFHTTASGEAKVLGSIVHARCEAWLKGTTLSPQGLPEWLYAASLEPYDRFRQWFDGAGLEPVHSELQLVVGHPWYYGGTIDFVAKDAEGRLVLGDIKTTAPRRGWPYPTVLSQVAAYSEAYATHYSKPDRHVVYRAGKDSGDPGQQVWLTEDQVKDGWFLFAAAREAYDVLKRLEASVR